MPKGVEGKLPEDQYQTWNTQLCKTIGAILGISPAKLEYAVNAYSGGLYGRTARATEKIVGLEERQQVKADMPLIGTLFVRDPYAPKAQVERFYERRDLLEQKYRSRKITIPEYAERQLYGQITRNLSPLWKALQKAKTVQQRKRLYAAIRILTQTGLKVTDRLETRQ